LTWDLTEVLRLLENAGFDPYGILCGNAAENDTGPALWLLDFCLTDGGRESEMLLWARPNRSSSRTRILARPRRTCRVEQSLVGPPQTIRIPQDERRFEYVGRLPEGRQFMAFVTGAFPDGVKLDWDTEEWQKVKRWMAVLHLFDADGNRLSTEVRLGGFDIEGRDVAGDKAWTQLDKMLAGLGPGKPELGEIWVKQFRVSIDGVTHSLLYEQDQPEEDGPVFEYVMLEPRDIMFHPPWDSGEYST
jgi:hypothetical protein